VVDVLVPLAEAGGLIPAAAATVAAEEGEAADPVVPVG